MIILALAGYESDSRFFGAMDICVANVADTVVFERQKKYTTKNT